MSASAMPVIVDHPTTPTEPNHYGDTSNESFTTAFAMLLYNVCYLAYTQSVDISLFQAGDVLSNLWAVCCSNDLGRLVVVIHSLASQTGNNTFSTGAHMPQRQLCPHQPRQPSPSISHSCCRRQLRALPDFIQLNLQRGTGSVGRARSSRRRKVGIS